MPAIVTSAPSSHSSTASRLKSRFAQTRAFSEELCRPLETEDYVIQSMPDASPTKWHLAHVSWFFETFLLKEHVAGYVSPYPQYNFLFNSYYNTIGARHERFKRGLVSRPTVAQTYEYRRHIDEAMMELMNSADGAKWEQIAPLIELGIHHEQQHQELIITDLKHALSSNPLRPTYGPRPLSPPANAPLLWKDFEGGLYEIGATGDERFSFDNEGPRHRVWLEPFSLASRLTTCGEWLEFIEDGGYRKPQYWLSAGWNWVQNENIAAPFYWEWSPEGWAHFTLAGMQSIEPTEPVAHLSFYEAEAFARWSEARLPTEFEWEVAACGVAIEGNFAESGALHPVAPSGEFELFGNLWQWTRSQYSPYPRYQPDAGALGEYNGKFMCNQFVLRGGSCATPQSHIRASYRNFFPPDARWQFTGLRLARDI